ncbi:23S rRNA (pseudouridine(1915)-N(3))-methyltransferase RlmH [Spongiivirga citrea]|uniref:Ribosomal RNA large subunit methyltransferase H n=1 Tax=Spongiivirga citrea TaxID=1481457 RepID=A0A6M0CV17_9FLAO|nr:23S rRNA (pseudouridine(1915)-N(3))-methyltransferase RlmH [Spongiivirga citrea]NER17630.1 23S rRNA (pseudouridine(1915)-N(3))-methyltransferase RlmH [Spongiivirga citrea]
MNISLLAIGKTDKSELTSLIDDYTKRLGHYVNFSLDIIPDIKNTKNLNEAQQKEKEGELLLKKVKSSDYVILLDEKGKNYDSVQFSGLIQKKMNAGLKQVFFVIGGPYGFSPSVYQRANEKLSLSKMTFSHQIIRLFMVEQLYRAFTIIKNEPYHHR